MQFEVADDRLDCEPFFRRQLSSRHPKVHTSLTCRRLDEELRITPWCPAQNYLSFIDSSASEFLGQLAGCSSFTGTTLQRKKGASATGAAR